MLDFGKINHHNERLSDIYEKITYELARFRNYTVFKSRSTKAITILNKKTAQVVVLRFNKIWEFPFSNDLTQIVTLHKSYHRETILHKRLGYELDMKEIIDEISDFFGEFSDNLGPNVYNSRYKKYSEYNDLIRRKEIVYVDLDGVLVDIVSEYKTNLKRFDMTEDDCDLGTFIDKTQLGFLTAKPFEGSLEAIARLETKYDVFILSTPPWHNEVSWSQKRVWVEEYLPTMYKKLILAPNKSMLNGSYLIDDRLRNGAGEFEGELIQIFTEKYPTWESVLKKLKV